MYRIAKEIIVSLALTSIPLGVAVGQRSAPSVNSRVRVVAADALDRDGRASGEVRTATGSVVSLTRDTLRVMPDGQSAATVIPMSHIVEMYESDGFHSHARRGALIGLGIGVALAGYLEFAAPSACDPGTICLDNDQALKPAFFLAGSVLFGGIGAGLGAIIGSGSHEHWRPLSNPPRVGAFVVPRSGDTRLGLAVRW